nr:LOW QUALITY PROTEIN: acid phosphatase-like [Quercus suber]
MIRSLAAAISVAAVGVAAHPQADVNTATQTQSVNAAQATAKTSQETSFFPGLAFDRFVTIWLENTDYSKAAGDPNLAYLASKGITLENYFGVTHPSEPNYVASHGGEHFGMDNDNFNSIAGNVSAITDLLDERLISWGAYQEDMPYSGFEGFAWKNQNTGANDYVRKHNPPIIFETNTDARSLSYIKNMTQFQADLEAKKLPQWMFITPNMTSDGHDTSVTTAGAWTRNFLEPLLDNPYFMKNTLILVTFDENHTYTRSNRVFSFLLGGAVPKSAVGTTDSNFYNHYSELSTVEANWHLNTLGRWDVGANVFDLVAKKTGDVVRTHEAATGENPTIFYNSSYAGPFNTGFQSAPYPAPNILLLSPFTLRTVSPGVIAHWGLHTDSYYTDSVAVPDGQNPPKGYARNDKQN